MNKPNGFGQAESTEGSFSESVTECSVTFFAALAIHAKRRSWESHQPHLADRLAAGLAQSVASIGQSLQGAVRLLQQFTLVCGQRHFGIALKRVRANISLIVAGSVDSAGQNLLKIAGSVVEFFAQPIKVGREFFTDGFGLGSGPRLFV